MLVSHSIARAVLLAATLGMVAALLRAESYFEFLLNGWDAQFYYAAARSMVHDGDLDVTNDLPLSPAQWVFEEAGHPTVPRSPSGAILNKYPIGTSLAEMVPLALSRAVMGDGANGYSLIEIRCVALWLVLLHAGGLWVTWRWLRLTTDGTVLQAVSVVLVLAGTSQLFYAAIYPFLAHGLSALLVAGCLLTAERTRGTPGHVTSLLAWGLLSVLLILVRPQQATLVMLLCAALLWEHRARRDRAGWVAAIALTAVLSAVLLQCVVNLQAIGQFRFNAYAAAGEGFNLLAPDFYTVFLSPGRGLFFLAPVALLAVPGAIVGAARSSVTAAAAVHLLVQVFLIAAWSSPEQGDAFGTRMLVDISPILAFGLHSVLRRVHRGPAMAVVGAVLLLCVAWTTLALGVYVTRGIPVGATHRGVVISARDVLRSTFVH